MITTKATHMTEISNCNIDNGCGVNSLRPSNASKLLSEPMLEYSKFDP